MNCGKDTNSKLVAKLKNKRAKGKANEKYMVSSAELTGKAILLKREKQQSINWCGKY